VGDTAADDCIAVAAGNVKAMHASSLSDDVHSAVFFASMQDRW